MYVTSYLPYLYQVFNCCANLLCRAHVCVHACVYVFSVLINLKCIRKTG